MRRAIGLSGLVVGFTACAGFCYAAVPGDFALRVQPSAAEVPESGKPVDFALILETTIDATQGWSLGAMIETDAGVTASITALRQGEALETIKDGAGADFEALNWYAAGDLLTILGSCSMADGACSGIDAGAFNQGITIDILTVVTLPATSAGIAVVEGTVEASGPEGEKARLVFSDVVGSPVIQTVIVHGGLSVVPEVQEGLTIDFAATQRVDPAQFTIAITGGEGDTGDAVESTVSLSFNDNPADPVTEDIQGWSYGVCVEDTAKLRVADATTDGTMTGTAKDGEPPDFNVVTLYEDGVTHGVSLSLTEPLFSIPPQNDWTDIIVTYEILMTEEGDATYVTPCGERLGTPPLRNVMAVKGRSVLMSPFEGIDPEDELVGCADIESCNIPGRLRFLSGAAFIPGSANGDGGLNIADCIYLLAFIFADGPALPCEKAGDANGDCMVDSSDAVCIFDYLLRGPPRFPPPTLGIGCQFVRGSVCRELSCEVPECEP